MISCQARSPQALSVHPLLRRLRRGRLTLSVVECRIAIERNNGIRHWEKGTLESYILGFGEIVDLIANLRDPTAQKRKYSEAELVRQMAFLKYVLKNSANNEADVKSRIKKASRRSSSNDK